MRESIARFGPAPATMPITSDGLRRAHHHPGALRGARRELAIDYGGSSPESRRGINVS
jgi:hypothetical protein